MGLSRKNILRGESRALSKPLLFNIPNPNAIALA